MRIRAARAADKQASRKEGRQAGRQVGGAKATVLDNACRTGSRWTNREAEISEVGEKGGVWEGNII